MPPTLFSCLCGMTGQSGRSRFPRKSRSSRPARPGGTHRWDGNPRLQRHKGKSCSEISLLQVTFDFIWYTELNWLKRHTTVRILHTKTLLLYLVIRGKLLHSDQHLWNRQVPLCPLYPLLKMHYSKTSLTLLSRSLPRIRRYSNSVLVWRIPTVVFLFNHFNSVYQIRSKVTRKRLIQKNQGGKGPINIMNMIGMNTRPWHRWRA